MPNLDEVNERESRRRLEEITSAKPRDNMGKSKSTTKRESKLKYYHEDGIILKVEVLEEKEKSYGNTRGTAYKLLVLEVIDGEGFLVNKGLEFEVWAADDSGGYAGWHLLDD